MKNKCVICNDEACFVVHDWKRDGPSGMVLMCSFHGKAAKANSYRVECENCGKPQRRKTTAFKWQR